MASTRLPATVRTSASGLPDRAAERPGATATARARLAGIVTLITLTFRSILTLRCSSITQPATPLATLRRLSDIFIDRRRRRCNTAAGEDGGIVMAIRRWESALLPGLALFAAGPALAAGH